MLFLKYKIGIFLQFKTSYDTLYILFSYGRKAERGQLLLNTTKICVKISVPLSLKIRLLPSAIIFGEKP